MSNKTRRHRGLKIKCLNLLYIPCMTFQNKMTYSYFRCYINIRTNSRMYHLLSSWPLPIFSKTGYLPIQISQFIIYYCSKINNMKYQLLRTSCSLSGSSSPTFNVSGSIISPNAAENKNSSKYPKGSWLNIFPLRALPITPKLITQFSPFPFSSTENSQGMQKPRTSMILESQYLITPQITLCTTTSLTTVRQNSSTTKHPSKMNRVRFLRHLSTALQKVAFAKPQVAPTMIVLMGSETPKRSKVNCVRQQNICIMNISSDPPSRALSQLGMKMLFQCLYLSFSLLLVKFSVQRVRKNASMAQIPVRGHREKRKTFGSPSSKKYNPNVISLATHPKRTFTQLCSLLSSRFSFKNKNVRLLSGPMHKFAAINPAHRSKLAAIELPNSSSELTRNSGLLPTTSDSTPVRKLPTAQARKVQRVRLSRSQIGRKITLRISRPESQNSQTRVDRKRVVIVDISYKRNRIQFYPRQQKPSIRIWGLLLTTGNIQNRSLLRAVLRLIYVLSELQIWVARPFSILSVLSYIY